MQWCTNYQTCLFKLYLQWPGKWHSSGFRDSKEATLSWTLARTPFISWISYAPILGIKGWIWHFKSLDFNVNSDLVSNKFKNICVFLILLCVLYNCCSLEKHWVVINSIICLHPLDPGSSSIIGFQVQTFKHWLWSKNLASDHDWLFFG